MWRGFLFVFLSIIYLASKLNQKIRIVRRFPLPPGPPSLPLLWNILEIRNQPQEPLTQWAKTYGPIFMAKMGPLPTIVLSDYKMIRELFSERGSSGRPLQDITRGLNGVSSTFGKHFTEEKNFELLRMFRDLGVKKTTIDSMVLAETQGAIHWIRSQGKCAMVGNDLFSKATQNVISNFVAGIRYEWETAKPAPVLEAALPLLDWINVIGGSTITMFIPFLKYVAPDYFGWNQYNKAIDKLNEIVDALVEDHEQTRNLDQIGDLLDAGPSEIRNCQNSESCFYGERGYFKAFSMELYLTGSEATASMLSWAMLYLTMNLPIQKNREEKSVNTCKNCPIKSYK